MLVASLDCSDGDVWYYSCCACLKLCNCHSSTPSSQYARAKLWPWGHNGSRGPFMVTRADRPIKELITDISCYFHSLGLALVTHLKAYLFQKYPITAFLNVLISLVQHAILCQSNFETFVQWTLSYFVDNVSVLWREEGYTVKYSLSRREIPRAEPEGFPEGSGYISQYILTWVTIQTISFS